MKFGLNWSKKVIKIINFGMLRESVPIIFLAFANAKDDLGYLAEEHQLIRRQLYIAKEKGLCDIIERFNLDLATLIDVFQSREYSTRLSIFHYAGHAGDFSMLLRDSEVNGLVFNKLLGQLFNLKLVFLNGCSTKKQAENLVELGLPVVIATSQEIPDDSAKIFASRFYRGLVEGHSIKKAFEQAEINILSTPGNYYVSTRLSNPRMPKLKPELLWKIYNKNEDAIDWKLEDEINNPYFTLPKPRKSFFPKSPYISLKPYSSNEASIFWGRGTDIKDIVDTLLDESSNPIILLYGQSGVGKSSLLDAGLVPRLSSVSSVKYTRRKSELGLTETLKSILSPINNAEQELGWDGIELESERMFLIVDQLDEAFTKSSTSKEEVLDFFNFVYNLLFKNKTEINIKVVLSYRKEYHAEIEHLANICNLPFTCYFLDSLKKDNILEIINGPNLTHAARIHYTFNIEDGLNELIANDLSKDVDSPIAPILQILLTKAWEKSYVINTNARTFSKDLYYQIKEEGIALSDFLTEQIGKISKWRPDVTNSGLILDILYVFTTSLGTAGSKAITSIEERYESDKEPLEIIKKCIDLYLLAETINSDGQKIIYLSHDTLAPIIRSFHDNSQLPGQRASRIIASQPSVVQGKESIILTKRDLNIVQEGQRGMRKWTNIEESIVSDSIKFHKNNEIKLKISKWLVWLGVIAGSLLSVFLYFSNNQKRLIQGQSIYVNGLNKIANKNYNLATREFLSSLKYNDSWALRSSLLEALSNQVSIVKRNSLNSKIITIGSYGEIAISVNKIFKADSRTQIKPSYKIIVSNLINNSLYYEFTSNEKLERAVISSDNKIIILGYEDGKIEILNSKHNNKLKSPPTHHSLISKISVSFDNNLVAYSNESGEVWIYNIHEGKDTLLVQRGGEPSRGLNFNSNSKEITVANSDTKLKLFELKGNQWIQRYVVNVSDDVIMDLVYSPDGKYVAAAGFDATISIINAFDGKSVKRIFGNTTSITSINFSSSGEEIISGAPDGSVRVFDVESTRELFQISANDAISKVLFKENRNSFVFGTEKGIVYHCNRNYNKVIHSLYDSSASSVRSIALTDNDKILAAGGDEKKPYSKIKIWNLKTSKVIKSFLAHRNNIADLVFGNKNKILVSVSDDNNVKFWETEQWIIKKQYNCRDALTSVTYSKDNSEFLVGERQGGKSLMDENKHEVPYSTIFIYNSSCELVDSIIHTGGSVYSISAPVNSLFSTGGGDNTVRLWNRKNKSEVYRFPSHTNSVWAVATNKDNGLLASGDIDGMIKVYNIKNKSIIKKLIGHNGGIFFLTFSPDGKWLASAGDDYTVRLWNLKSNNSIVLRNFNSPVWKVQFSHDGKLLYACGLSKEIIEFDIDFIFDLMNNPANDIIKKLKDDQFFTFNAGS